MKLDANTVDALRLDGKSDAIFFDDAMTGFGYRLRLGSNNKILKSWIVQYRRGGGTRRVLLGSAEVLKPKQAREAAKEVLAKVALGKDPAARVFAGTVRRGEVLSVEAVLFYADLRSFTPLADTMPARELIALLDDCFDCMARPLSRLGGEILKFMGDGLLAIFRTGERRRAEDARQDPQ